MKWQVGILAALYVLTGITALLPGAFVLLAVAVGLPFWYFFLRAGDPPVSLEAFRDGAAGSALATFPDFPFGLVGLGLLAMNCVLVFPNLFAGMALLEDKPESRKRALRAAFMNLIAFPLGTPLGIYALWALSRPVLPPGRQLQSLGDRAKAAVCYAVPLVGPVFVFVKGNAFVRLHAIQGLAVYGVIAIIVKVTEQLPPVAGVGLGPFAAAAVLTTLLVLAAQAFAGRSFKLPWIGALIEKWQGSVVEIVQQARGHLQENRDLAIHRSNLGGQAARKAVDLPQIAGTPSAGGFTQRTGNSLDAVSVGICVVIVLLFLGAIAKGIDHVVRHGWASVNWFGVAFLVVIFGGLLGFVLYSVARGAIASWMTGGELVVAHWPLRPGEETRVRYRSKVRMGAKVERIAAILKCTEAITWRDRKRTYRNAAFVVRNIAMADVTSLAAADGSVAAEWMLRMPRDAPPSFRGTGGALAWQFVVELEVAHVPDSTQLFDLLVVSEMAA